MRDSGKLVVARFLDGRLVRGQLEEFRVEEESFRIFEDGRAATTVTVRDLKALFFVKTLQGNPTHVPRLRFPEHGVGGTKTWVQFLDGEELAGWQISTRPIEDGFFLFPTDVHCNIEKAYIPRTALKKALHGDRAEDAARGYRDKRPRREVESGNPDHWEALIR